MSALVTIWMILAIAIILLIAGMKGEDIVKPTWKEVATGTGVMLLIVIAVAAVTIPISRKEVNTEILRFKVSTEVVRAAKVIEKKVGFKKSLWDKVVVKKNAWLLTKQEDNKGFFDIWIPDEVDNLKPLE